MCNVVLYSIMYGCMLRTLANSATHPLGVGKWVVIHVIRYMDYGVKA